MIYDLDHRVMAFGCPYENFATTNVMIVQIENSVSASDRECDDDVVLEERVVTKKPNLYKVLIHNDDYTTMDFVVMILTDVFHKSIDDATKIMLNVHHTGIGIAGIYTREICESKIEAVHSLAEDFEYPLLCTMEIA